MSDTQRTFPLRVNQEWLDRIDDTRDRKESKHAFVLTAVEREITRRKAGFDITNEEDK